MTFEKNTFHVPQIIDSEWPRSQNILMKLLNFKEKEKKYFGHLAKVADEL